MTFPLSKIEIEAFRTLSEKVKQKPEGKFSVEEYQKWQDLIALMVERGAIFVTKNADGWIYEMQGDFDCFKEWLFDQQGKAKKLSRREWKISIISSILTVGLTQLLPLVFQWIKGIF